MTRSELHELLSTVLTDFVITRNEENEVVIITSLTEDPETEEIFDPDELDTDEDFLPHNVFDVIDRFNEDPDAL